MQADGDAQSPVAPIAFDAYAGLSALPFRLVGTHRRLRLVDVLGYRDRQDAAAREALGELTRQAEDLGMYD